MMPVAGVGAGQGAQRHRAAHEAKIGVRFAGLRQLVHLIEAGESPLRRVRRASAWTGPGRSAKAEAMGTKPFRL